MLRTFALCVAMAVPAGAALAQDQTLADIRTKLSALYVDVTALRNELVASGQSGQGVAGATPLDRLNSIEAELTRLTSKTEELEFRITRITRDGTNRIGDLEFRLCELEAGCDIGALGETPSLGGVDVEPTAPAIETPVSTGPALAVAEQEDFTRAQEALASGDFHRAVDLLATFNESYPGSPVASDAHFLRGQAFENLGELTNAARAYLGRVFRQPRRQCCACGLDQTGYFAGGVGPTARRLCHIGRSVRALSGIGRGRRSGQCDGDAWMQLGEDVSAPAQAVRGYCLHLHDRPNFNVLIAVSGGSDSVALLRAAVELAQAEGGVVRAATVDHGLRSEAKDEAVWVADLCATLDVDHTTLTVPDLATGAALQARAREARYAALIGWAKGFKGVPLLLGHTRNDVAETFLMRLARGAGTAGLAEMQGDFTRGGVQFGRPLLRQSREDLQGWLRSLDQTWIEDPGNEDPTFDRVKVRRMLPQLDQIGLSVDQTRRRGDNDPSRANGIGRRHP